MCEGNSSSGEMSRLNEEERGEGRKRRGEVEKRGEENREGETRQENKELEKRKVTRIGGKERTTKRKKSKHEYK